MKLAPIRNVLLTSVAVLTCLNLATEEESESQNSVDDIFIAAKIYRCETILSDGKICGGVVGTSQTPIETAQNLLTKVSELPTPFERPENRQIIFRHGKWALIASRYTDTVISTDGQFEVDIEVPDIAISTLNWKPTVGMELRYQLFVADEEVFKSDYRTWRAESIPYLRGTEVSSDLIKALEEGTTLKVKLALRTNGVVHIDEYPLEGLSENLFAVRKLLKDSPRAERELTTITNFRYCIGPFGSVRTA